MSKTHLREESWLWLLLQEGKVSKDQLTLDPWAALGRGGLCGLDYELCPLYQVSL